MNRSITTPSPYRKPLFRIPGLVVAALSLVLFLALMVRYPFPDSWTSVLMSLTGADPFRPLFRPVWQLLASLVATVAGPSLPVAMNLLSVVFGALTIWLVYECGIRLRMRVSAPRSATPPADPALPRIVTGVVAALFAATCLPVLYAVTRANPLSLDMALLAGALLLTLLYRDEQRMGWWYLFAPLYGIGMAEFSTFLLLAPVFTLWWAFLFWRTDVFFWRQLALGLGLLVAGFFISVVFCTLYARSDAAAWQGFDSGWAVYKQYLVNQLGSIRGSVPKQGWLIIGLFMIAPALLVFLKGYETAEDAFTKYGLTAIRVVMVGLGVIMLFNLPGSPWRLVGVSPLLVTPYLITALWFGQLIGSFAHRIGEGKLDRLGRPNPTRMNRLGQRALIGVVGVVLVAGGVLNAPRVEAGRGKVLEALARDVLFDLGDRTWLITQGTLDVNLYWAARVEERPLRLLNLVAAQSMPYRNFLADQFDDPAIRSMAEAGISPLLNEWFAVDPSVAAKVGIMTSPDQWSFRGYEPVPRDGYYAGRRFEEAEQATLSADGAAEVLALLAAYEPVFGEDADRSPPLGLERTYAGLRDYLGVFANNVGFALQQDGAEDTAAEAFALSLAYQPDNLSAMVNLGQQLEAAGRTSEVEALQAAWDQATARLGGIPPPAQLAARYGYVSDIRIFLDQGRRLSRQGWGAAGAQRYQQALLYADQRPEVALSVAALLLEQGLLRESAELLEAVLADEPGTVDALRLLTRIRMMQEDIEAGEDLLDRLEAAGVSGETLLMERANLLLQQDNYDAAEELFRTLSRSQATRGPAAMGLLRVAEATANRDLEEEAYGLLEEARGFLPGQLHVFDQAYGDGDLGRAAQALARARRIQPGNPEVLLRSILMDARQGALQDARRKVQRLLAIDHDNPLGNYMLAELHLDDEAYDLAEAALRRSLASSVLPDTLNALAWTLYLQGRYEEGLSYATQAVERNPDHPLYLSTCGMLLLRNDQAELAETRLRRAVERAGDRIPILRFHLAEILATQGKVGEARDQLASVTERTGGWNTIEQEALDRAQALLDPSG